MKDKGKLTSWNEKRGFGFIKCKSFDDDIFIHISALKQMVRKPRVGDVIYFDRILDKQGKQRAEYASIKGVEIKPVDEVSDERVERISRNSNKTSLSFVLLVFIGLVAAFYLYQTLSPNPVPISMPEKLKGLFKKENAHKEDFSGFSCQGKRYCSQMSSCKEARFYLKNCPNVKIDGDGDGVPCEKQWCDEFGR